MEAVDHLTEPAVADLGGQLGRAHHVNEEHGAQEPVGAGERPLAGHELLDGIQHRVGVADEVEQVGTGELEVLRASDVLGQIARVCCAGKTTFAAWAMTSVGTLIAGSTPRTSTSNHCRAIAAAVAGLADIR
jgi:hypothetical protein